MLPITQILILYIISPMMTWLTLLITRMLLMYLTFTYLSRRFISLLVLLVFVGGIIVLFIFLSSIYPNEPAKPLKFRLIFFFFFFFLCSNSLSQTFSGFSSSMIHDSIYFLFILIITIRLSFFLYLCSYKGLTIRSFLYFPFSL